MSVRTAIGAWLVYRRPIRVAILAVLLAAVFSSSTVMLPSLYAQTFGATLTVLRGSAAVLQANGTPHSPAANGQTLGVGDQVATLTGGSALVTFFDGSEVELGAETTVIIREMDQRGGTTTITLESVVGTTLNRVVTLTGEQSSYRIETGGTVAVVRGTVFAHHRDASGDVTVAVGEGTVDFPSPGQPLRPGEKRTATSRGDVVDTHIDPAVPLITTVLEPVSRSNPSGTQNPGLATGSFVAPQQQSLQQQSANEPQDDPPPLPLPGHTVLVSPAAAGSTRLDVASTTGFAVGDAIKVGSGPDAEFHVVTGFGSILVEPPLGRSFEAGTSVDVIPNGSFPLPTRGTGEQPTPTLTPTKTPATAATLTPTATPESPAPTATETKTVTATPSESPTVSPTASPTMSVTATAAGTPTITPIATSTVTATALATATMTNTATATATNTATATPTITPTATPTVTLTATSTVTPTATPTPPFPCLGPLTRQLATRGSGTTGTTRSVTASGIRLTAFVQLTDATPDTAFDFYIDVGGGSAGDHQLIGTFSTDGQGNATFTGSIVVPTVAANIDNELVLQGDVQSRHQYIRELFPPCPE